MNLSIYSTDQKIVEMIKFFLMALMVIVVLAIVAKILWSIYLRDSYFIQDKYLQSKSSDDIFELNGLRDEMSHVTGHSNINCASTLNRYNDSPSPVEEFVIGNCGKHNRGPMFLPEEPFGTSSAHSHALVA